MEFSENYFLPFRMRGTTCYFESRSPDIEELESCWTFQVSDANHWNPTDEIYILAVRRRHNSVCASDVFDVYVSELHVYVSELHEVCVCMNSTCYKEAQRILYHRSGLLNATMGSMPTYSH